MKKKNLWLQRRVASIDKATNSTILDHLLFINMRSFVPPLFSLSLLHSALSYLPNLHGLLHLLTKCCDNSSLIWCLHVKCRRHEFHTFDTDFILKTSRYQTHADVWRATRLADTQLMERRHVRIITQLLAGMISMSRRIYILMVTLYWREIYRLLVWNELSSFCFVTRLVTTGNASQVNNAAMAASPSTASMIRNASDKEMGNGNGDVHKVPYLFCSSFSIVFWKLWVYFVGCSVEEWLFFSSIPFNPSHRAIHLFWKKSHRAPKLLTSWWAKLIAWRNPFRLLSVLINRSSWAT